MIEHPILFSGEMIRAIREGRKTVTRRLIKPQPLASFVYRGFIVEGSRTTEGTHEFGASHRATECETLHLRCPHGGPGDRLWVRENWRYYDWTDDGYPWIEYQSDNATRLVESGFGHAWGDRLGDIWADLSDPANFELDNRAADRRWRPSIHMPRWASRITLELVSVRAERLQDITERECILEGIGSPITRDCKRPKFASLWDALNGERASWASNPWVWREEFRRIDT